MKNFVISLTTAQDRRAHIVDEFAKKQVDFEFFDAITPQTLHHTAQYLQIDLQKNTDLSNNELSCLCSHLALWRKAIDENLDYIAIFEDDIYLSRDAQLFLSNTDWIPSNCDFIKLEKVAKSVVLTDKQPVHQHQLARLNSPHFGTGGYILSNLAACKLYEHFLTIPAINHIDQYLFKMVLTSGILPIYQINPVVCIQDCILHPTNQKFDSLLEWRDKQPKIKLSPTQKLIRELKRPLQKLQQKMQQTKLEFYQ